jgi:EAL domain-containing protein (putative c-di-GMP-specific phosphodiesterase class I)
MFPRQAFIRLAEETGLIIPIGAWVLETACRACLSWQQIYPDPLRVAVNLSPRQFRQPDLAGSIATILENTGLPASYLEVEITEGLLLEDMDCALHTLQSLRTLGVHISVDDFGTGHSSLTYLKHLPFDCIKIDRSFIHDIPGDAKKDLAITKAIIALGHSLNLKVIAEGVETIEQLSYLQKHGCDLVQGYLISKPLSESRIKQWWEEKGPFLKQLLNQNSTKI